MEVPNNVVENLFRDFQKKDINKFMRGQIIKKYLDEQKISGREFARKFDIPKSTVEDWLLWTKLSEEQYNNLKETGITHTDIYRELRNNKNKSTNEILNESDIDRTLVKFIFNSERCMKQFPPKTKKTNELLNQAKELLLRLELHYNQ